MKSAAVKAIGKIIDARQEQLRFRLLLAMVIAAAFQPITGLSAAAAWLAIYVVLQLSEHRMMARLSPVTEAQRLDRAWTGVAACFVSNLCLAAFGVLEVLHSGVWGLVCAVMLWIGIITYGAVMSAGSRHAAIAATAPPAAGFLLAPVFAVTSGAPALYGWLVVLGAALSIASTLAVLGLARALHHSRQHSELLEQALYTDSDTSLPTRYALTREAEEAIRAGAGHTMALLMLNRSAHLRGVLGFEQFPRLMALAAERLNEVHGGVVAVITTDCLGLNIPHADERSALAYAAKLRDCFNAPLMLDGAEIDVSIVMGLAELTTPRISLRHATIAIQQAQAARQALCLFDPIAYGDPSSNLALMSRMLDALNGDMALHYQPKLHLRSGEVRSAEALCRWTDAQRGPVPVAAFIAMAEETGHIRALTEWVIERAVADQKSLADRGYPLSLAVNISAGLLSNSEFAGWAQDAVQGARGKIIFEVTETAVINDPERALTNVDAWADAGIPIAIDDYGAGLSSLTYLKNLPARELKLDRSLVGDIADDGKDALLVKSTIELAHGLGLEVTAEGVETPAALAALRLVGCDWAQGYLLSRPLGMAAFSAFLENFSGEVLAQGLADLTDAKPPKIARRA